MNVGELKLQNAFLNSQLQLNNDLLNSKQTNVRSFDDILKRKTNNRSVNTDDGFQRQREINKPKMKLNTGDGFNKKVGADFSKRDSNQAIGLRKQINGEIAQNKFSKKNENVKAEGNNKEISAVNNGAKSIEDIEEKLKALEEKIKDELGITLEEAPITEEVITDELISELASLLGVDLEIVEEILLNSEIELTDDNLIELVEVFIDKPEVLEVISEKLELVTDPQVLENFRDVLNEVVQELPEGELKTDVEEIVHTIDTKIYESITESDVESKSEVVSEIVTDKVEPTKELKDTDSKLKASNDTNELETKDIKEVKIVESKESDNARNSDKQDGPVENKVKTNVKAEIKADTQATKGFEEQVNVMKEQNTNITSAKVAQPRMLLAKSITSQIVQGAKMSVNLSDVGSEILIKLNPKNLGNVALKMSFEKGVLMAQINVENQTVKALVESNLEDLKNSLKDEGYMIGDLDVSVNKDNSDSQQQSFNENSKASNKNETFEEIEGKVLQEKHRFASKEKIDYLA